MSATTWTETTVREELPDVPVKHQGKTYTGLVRGRRNDAATVSIEVGRGSWVSGTFSWWAISDALNNGRLLSI